MIHDVQIKWSKAEVGFILFLFIYESIQYLQRKVMMLLMCIVHYVCIYYIHLKKESISHIE